MSQHKFKNLILIYLQFNMLDQSIQNKKDTLNQKVQENHKICEFYVQRKKRQCKFKAMKGSKFCNSHCSDLQGKVKCPYEKGTYIDIANFQKHLENCPMIKQKKKTVASAWFEKDINQKAIDPNKMRNQDQSQKTELLNNESDSALKLQSTKHELANIDPLKIEQIIPKIIDIYLKSYPQQLGQKLVQSSVVQQTPQQVQTNDHKQAFLIAERALQHKLISPQIIYVQFGAGKGILSYAVGKKVQQISKRLSKNILLERQSRRFKFDKHFRSNPYFQRYKSDVSDFNMANIGKVMIQYIKQRSKEEQRLESIRKSKTKHKQGVMQEKTIKKQKKQQKILSKQQEKQEKNNDVEKQTDIKLQEQLQDLDTAQKVLLGYPLIGICKHMCGLALDISVRGLLKAKIGGSILASCCHHLCTYDSFLNVQFFQRQGLSAEQIHLLFKLSSWGTKSSIVVFKNTVNFEKLKKEQEDFQLQTFQEFLDRTRKRKVGLMAQIEKVVIGRMCKRLIDKARAQFLGGSVERYCSDQLTPENYVIVSNNL